MKKLTILLLPFLMISCSKLGELTPENNIPTHFEIHVFAKESICILSINDTTMYLGNTRRKEVYLFKVKELNYLNFISYAVFCLKKKRLSNKLMVQTKELPKVTLKRCSVHSFHDTPEQITVKRTEAAPP